MGRIGNPTLLLSALVISAGLGTRHTAALRAAGTPLPAAAPASTAAARLPRVHAPRIRGRFQSTSTNWSGYVVNGTGMIDVQGNWTVPAVTAGTGCPSSYSAAWVGIDGDTDSTVEQCGTEQESSGSYYAWYEMYPQGSVFVANVRPGDQIHAEVHYTNNGRFQLVMTDNGTLILNTSQPLKRAQRSSAEWIMEAPWSGGVLPLADWNSFGFGFSSCTWQGSGGSPQRIIMVNNSGQPKATPGNWAGGFPVTWNNCQ